MGSIALKLVLTPLFITVTTLAARRWGPVIGGLIVGLPLTSGPVSVFLAIEQGRDFAAAAAQSTLLGVLAVVAFCVSYAKCSRRLPWLVCALAALCCYFLTVAAFSSVKLSLPASLFLVVAVISVCTWLVKPVSVAIPILPAPRWDLPFRIMAATAIVLTITAISSRLGPQLSGLLSTFPVFICVMSAFSHKLNGPDATQQFERGVVIGSFSFAAFFLTVSLLIHNSNLFVVYMTASVMAMGVNLAVFKLLVSHKRQ